MRLSNHALCNFMTLFIVEDDNIQSLILEMMVSKLGFDCKGKSDNGKHAVEEILQIKPDIILMDVMLKDTYDGIDVARIIKSHYDPVIIYVSGNSDGIHKNRAEKYGYHDFIAKPVSIHKLKQAFDTIGEN